jgi:cation transport ATPase
MATNQNGTERREGVAGCHDVDREAFQLAVCCLLTLPLAAHWVALGFGWSIFFLGDPHIQTVWASLILLAGGWPFYAGSFRRGGNRGFTATVAGLVTVFYGYGLYLTVFRPDVRTHPYYQIEACVITAATVVSLVSALARRQG